MLLPLGRGGSAQLPQVFGPSTSAVRRRDGPLGQLTTGKPGRPSGPQLPMICMLEGLPGPQPLTGRLERPRDHSRQHGGWTDGWEHSRRWSVCWKDRRDHSRRTGGRNVAGTTAADRRGPIQILKLTLPITSWPTPPAIHHTCFNWALYMAPIPRFSESVVETPCLWVRMMFRVITNGSEKLVWLLRWNEGSWLRTHPSSELQAPHVSVPRHLPWAAWNPISSWRTFQRHVLWRNELVMVQFIQAVEFRFPSIQTDDKWFYRSPNMEICVLHPGVCCSILNSPNHTLQMWCHSWK